MHSKPTEIAVEDLKLGDAIVSTRNGDVVSGLIYKVERRGQYTEVLFTSEGPRSYVPGSTVRAILNPRNEG